jgi:hypothetical protein
MTEQHTDGYKRKSGQVLVRTLPGQITSQWRLPELYHHDATDEIDCRAKHSRTQRNKKAVLVRTHHSRNTG